MQCHRSNIVVTSIIVIVRVIVITGSLYTCLHEELVADAGVVHVVHGCRKNDRKRLQVRYNVLQHTQQPEVHATKQVSKYKNIIVPQS